MSLFDHCRATCERFEDQDNLPPIVVTIDRDHQHVAVTGQHPAIVEVTRAPAVRLSVYKQHHWQLGPVWKDKSDTQLQGGH